MPDMFEGFCQPLLDTTVVGNENLLKKYDRKINDAVLAVEKHMGINEELENDSVQKPLRFFQVHIIGVIAFRRTVALLSRRYLTIRSLYNTYYTNINFDFIDYMPGMFVGFCQPLLDTTEVGNENLLKKYDRKINDAVLAVEKHMGINEELENDSVQKSLRFFQ